MGVGRVEPGSPAGRCLASRGVAMLMERGGLYAGARGVEGAPRLCSAWGRVVVDVGRARSLRRSPWKGEEVWSGQARGC